MGGGLYSGNYRAPWHDYKERRIYHITLLKSDEADCFGILKSDCRKAPGNPGAPYVAATKNGKAIKEALRHIEEISAALRLYQYALMPDHLHLLLAVEVRLDEHLGNKIAALKALANSLAGGVRLFADGYNDQIMSNERSLAGVYKYLRSNPWRLAVRRANPDYFRQLATVNAGGTPCQAYGNLQLLENPFIEQVIVHRADTPQQFEANLKQCVYTAANGGVLVSPFISPRERQIREAALAAGGRIILISPDLLEERQKPAGREFELCITGRMLRLSPPAA